MKNEYTQVCTKAEVGYDVHVCNDCGAHADTPAEVKHWPKCNPGECKHWEQYYKNAEESEMIIRCIIAGGRNCTRSLLEVKEVMDRILRERVEAGDTIEIVSGTAPGADRLGEAYALARGYKCVRFPANWRPNGIFDKAAGFKRNEIMAEYATHLVAFWDGKSRGTQHMINRAEKHGLTIRISHY